MACAEPFFLLKGGVTPYAVKVCCDLLFVRADNNGGIIYICRFYGVKHPAEHRIKQHLCKNLRLIGFHSFAVSCGEYYCVFIVVQNRSFLCCIYSF